MKGACPCRESIQWTLIIRTPNILAWFQRGNFFSSGKKKSKGQESRGPNPNCLLTRCLKSETSSENSFGIVWGKVKLGLS